MVIDPTTAGLESDGFVKYEYMYDIDDNNIVIWHLAGD